MRSWRISPWYIKSLQRVCVASSHGVLMVFPLIVAFCDFVVYIVESKKPWLEMHILNWLYLPTVWVLNMLYSRMRALCLQKDPNKEIYHAWIYIILFPESWARDSEDSPLGGCPGVSTKTGGWRRNNESGGGRSATHHHQSRRLPDDRQTGSKQSPGCLTLPARWPDRQPEAFLWPLGAQATSLCQQKSWPPTRTYFSIGFVCRSCLK